MLYQFLKGVIALEQLIKIATNDELKQIYINNCMIRKGLFIAAIKSGLEISHFVAINNSAEIVQVDNFDSADEAIEFLKFNHNLSEDNLKDCRAYAQIMGLSNRQKYDY